MTSSQSPETSLINGQLGTNEGSAFSTRHVHPVPIVDRVLEKSYSPSSGREAMYCRFQVTLCGNK
jgi:hypothetical protein